jgi:hypothetical protein
VTAVDQLVLSAENLRIYLAAGERERRTMADSLREAAKAYGDVDDAAAQAIDNETPMAAARPVRTKGDMVALGDTPLAAAGDLDKFADVIQNAWAIERGGDQGVSLNRFADEWSAYRRSLSQAAMRFRPFVDWAGDAALAAQASMEKHRQWLYQMAELCNQLVSQAREISSAHKSALDSHVSVPKGFLSSRPVVNEPWLRYDYERLVSMQTYYLQHPENVTMRQEYPACFAKFQQTSEQVLEDFRRKVDVRPLQPSTPPNVGGDFIPNPGLPNLGLPSDNNLPFTGMPTMPSLPSAPPAGMPAGLDDSKLAGASKDKPRLPTGPGIKPASFGGGMPSMPSRSLGDADSASRVGAAGPGNAGGLKVPPAYAALGRGGAGAGGGPMGAPGAGQKQDGQKGKRVQGDEQQALYTEDRPWTAGVIGNRRRQEISGQ